MNRYRVLMILTALLASAAAVNAQSLSSASLQALREAGQATETPEAGLTLPSPYYLKHFPQYYPPSPAYPLPKELASMEEAAKAYFEMPPVANEQCWFVQAIDQTVAALQKVRTLCQTQAKSERYVAPPSEARYEGSGYPKAAFDPPINHCPATCGVKAAAKPAACCVGSDAGVCKGLPVPSAWGCGLRVTERDIKYILEHHSSLNSNVPSSAYRIFIVPIQLTPSGERQGGATPILKDLVRDPIQWLDAGDLQTLYKNVYASPAVPFREIKSFIQFLPAPPNGAVSSAPCCCAKACACCESCKAARAAQVQVPPMLPPQGAWNVPVPPPHAPGFPPMPPGGPSGPPVWVGPQPQPMVPGVPMCMPMPPRPQPAHFVTPDFDGHCEKITHRGDSVILEGNVMLLCKKHAQPIRVEGQRIVVNMKDGSYSVETNLPKAPVGIHIRGSASELQHQHEVAPFMPVQAIPPRFDMHYAPMQSGQRIIQVMPVPTMERPR